MPKVTSKQTIALVVAAVASIGLAVLAFAPERSSIDPLPVIVLGTIVLAAVSVFDFTQRQGGEQHVRVLWILALSVAAMLPLLLIIYFILIGPEHIVTLSLGGCLLGFLIGMLLYHSLGNHLKDGIIIYEGTVLYQVTSISLTVAGAVALYLMAVMSPRHGVMLIWLFMCAFLAYLIYLAVAVFHLELKTGQKIRFAYPQEMSRRRRSVVMIVWLIALVVFFFAMIRPLLD